MSLDKGNHQMGGRGGVGSGMWERKKTIYSCIRSNGVIEEIGRCINQRKEIDIEENPKYI